MAGVQHCSLSYPQNADGHALPTTQAVRRRPRTVIYLGKTVRRIVDLVIRHQDVKKAAH
jgi:hypothetical protein